MNYWLSKQLGGNVDLHRPYKVYISPRTGMPNCAPKLIRKLKAGLLTNVKVMREKQGQGYA